MVELLEKPRCVISPSLLKRFKVRQLHYFQSLWAELADGFFNVLAIETEKEMKHLFYERP